MAKFLNLLKLRSFANAGDAAAEVATINDQEPRLRIDAGGKLNWGAGVNSPDTTLYRSAADTLKTDDAFVAAGGLTIKTYEVDTAGASAGYVLAFNGTKFAPASAAGGGASITVSDTAPSSPTEGAMWFESDTGKTFIYYDSTWVEIGGGGGGTSDPMNDSKFTAIITMDIGV